MIFRDILYVFVIAFGGTLFLIPLVRKMSLRFQILDMPGKRKVHTKPVPTLGGIAIFISFIAAVLFALCFNQEFRLEFAPYLMGLILGGAVVVVLGIFHDLNNLRPFVKLCGQILVGFLLFYFGLRIEYITNPFGGQIHLNLLTSLIVTVFWTVALINAVNLIDGLDGLAAGLTTISLLALLSIALFKHHLATIFLIAALMGTSVGFLKYNFYPAKIFMGDTGSMFLGFALACISILGYHKMVTSTALLIPLIALGIPIFDTLLAVVRRLLKRHSIFKADKKHLHHRLLDMGLSHKQVVLFLYLICAYFGVIAFLFVLISKEYAFILLILLGMGVFMGVRTIGFIERKVRLMQRMEKKLSENDR